MSAIAAILRFDGAPVQAADMASMLNTMAARSPDGQTSWSEGSVALGHGMLLNTPEALHERQPLVALDGRLRMVWDGRLDNRDELRHELSLRGVLPRDDTDPELVLQLFLIFRENTPERLIGDFAFVIYDQQQGSLFCARDHVGARPLHYVLTDKLIAVASDDEALIPFLPNGARPNRDRFVYALIPLLDDFDWACGWIEGVMSLPAGTHMSASAGRRVRRLRYWQLRAGDGLQQLRPDDAINAFSEVLELATRDRLRTVRPPALLLSGGIDSACVAASINRQPTPVAGVVTYSVVSETRFSCVETDAIRSMLQILGWKSQQIAVPSSTDLAATPELTRLAWQRPHPVNNSILLIAALATLAGKADHRVLLHGVSGDLAFHTPDDYYVHVARQFGWRPGLREINLATARHVYNIGYSHGQLLLRALWGHGVPLAIKKLRPARRRAAAAVAQASGLGREFIVEQRVAERVEQAWARADRVARMSPQQQHRLVLDTPGLLRGLEGYDRVVAREGLEARDPLADVRVVEWLYRMPLAVKVADGMTKWVGRQYARRVFGDGVASRTDKTHLGEHFVAPALAGVSVTAEPASGVVADSFAALTLRRWVDQMGATPIVANWLAAAVDDVAR